jgi:hypothetical protein
MRGKLQCPKHNVTLILLVATGDRLMLPFAVRPTRPRRGIVHGLLWAQDGAIDGPEIA